MNISQRQGVLLSNGLSKQQKRSDRVAAEVLTAIYRNRFRNAEQQLPQSVLFLA